MAFGIALTFDAQLDARVRQVWRQFEAAGVGKTPGQLGESPHVTFSLFPSGNPKKLIELAEATPIFDAGVKLVPFGAFFGDSHALYYNVVLSRGLLEAHAKHYKILIEYGLNHDPVYEPGNILFHCTMAVDIAREQFFEGIDICIMNPKTLEGRAEQMELFEYFPVKNIYRKRIEAL
jgi:hypothetical protein